MDDAKRDKSCIIVITIWC